MKSSDFKPLGGTVLDGISAEEKKQTRPTFTEKAPIKKKGGKSVRFDREVRVKEFGSDSNDNE